MFVYLITNRINHKQYIGQTTKTVEERWEKHLENVGLGSKLLIYKAIRKHEKKNFFLTTLHECETKEEMDFVEMFYISLLRTKAPNGYNCTDGGEGQFGRKLSEEAIQKMKEAFTGKPNPKNSEHLKNNPRPRNPVTGRLLSDKEISTGNWSTAPAKATEETRLKMSKSHEGFRHTEASKAKMRGKRGPRKRKKTDSPYPEAWKHNSE